MMMMICKYRISDVYFNTRYTESIYCEPRDVSPYATSEDRPADWLVRQTMPLPPKPDDDNPPSSGGGPRSTGAAAAAAERCSPPPPYFPGRPATDPSAAAAGGLKAPTGQAPSPPSRSHTYINDEDADPCYFQPINDEEAQLIAAAAAGSPDSPPEHSPPPVPSSSPPPLVDESENAYLIARPPEDDDGDRDRDNDIEMKALNSEVPLSRQMPVDDVDDDDLVNGGTVYAIRRPSNANSTDNNTYLTSTT